jgi:small subunit ribosomal protein S24e
MAITNAGIEKEFDNKLLKRKELLISLEFEGPTPSRAEMKKALADKFNLKEENMVIVRAGQEFGIRRGRVLVHEYQDKEAMKVTQKHTLARPNAKKAAQAQQTSTASAAGAQKEEKK